MKAYTVHVSVVVSVRMSAFMILKQGGLTKLGHGLGIAARRDDLCGLCPLAPYSLL